MWSFAVIIDRAPSEVQQAGQDWCPMPIKREHIEKWLVPDASELVASHALLADRPSLCFESFPSSAERERHARPAPVRIINLWKPPGEATGPGEI